MIIMINIAILIANIIVLIIGIKAIDKKVPKWEYFADGIRFFNKKGESTIENDKPLIK